MRVLIVSQYFYPETFQINDLAKELLRKGHKVDVLTGQPNYPGGFLFPGYKNWTNWTENFEGIKIIRVPVIPRGSGRYWQLTLNYLSFVISGILFGVPRLLSQPFDVMIVFSTSPITSTLPAIVLKLIRNIPMALWVQDLWPDTVSAVGAVRSNVLLRSIGLMVKFIYSHCDQIWAQSQAFFPSIQKWGGTPEQIKYIPNWALENFSSVPQQVDRQKNPKLLRVLFAGNLGRAQSLETAVSAAKILQKDTPHVLWTFVGEGSEKEKLERDILDQGLGPVMKILPRRPSFEMPKLFSEYDALLVTLAKRPTFALVVPSKIQSYMASGKPIVAAVDGEARRVVEEAECGLAGPAEDPHALASNIKKMLLLSEKEREQMGDKGRKYYEREFERSMVIEKIDSTLRELAGQK